MEKKKIKLPAGVTGAMVKQMRQKHGKLLIVTVESEQTPDFEIEGEELVFAEETDKEVKTHVAIFKMPELGLLGEVTKKSKTDEMAALKLMFNGCKLAVDEEIINDTSLYLSVCNQLQQLTGQKKTGSQMF